MRKAGQVALMAFPRTDLRPGKRRPVLLLARVPGPYEDWLICMFSTKLEQAQPGFDETIGSGASDFEESGLKVPSVIRVGRLAVASEEVLIGAIGRIGDHRLHQIRETLAHWIRSAG
jgi:mRNA interferase MazF